MSKVKVAIAGVGNCASSLVQGVEYYREADPAQNVPGLMHVMLGGYHVGDLEFVAAFDVDATKVGTDLSKAIFAGHNNTIRFCAGRPHGRDSAAGTDLRRARPLLQGQRGRVPGGAGRCRRRPPSSGADVLVSYLPVGSEKAQRFYAQACLDAKVALRERHPRLHSERPGMGSQVQRGRRPDHR